MKIAVLMKQVPDMQLVKFDIEKKTIDRSSAGTEVNPYDLNALEMGLQIVEKVGGETVVISMGPDSGKEVILDGIARGADSGILLSDRKFGGADTIATAATLKAAIEKIGDVDIIICGEKTVDGDTGQVGAEVAEYLDIPHISYAEKLCDVSDKCITVRVNTMEALYEVRAEYPVLITVTKDINVPRLPSVKGKIKSKKQEVPKWSFVDIEEYIHEEDIGANGSPTRVRSIEITPPLKRECTLAKNEEEIDKLINIVSSKVKSLVEVKQV